MINIINDEVKATKEVRPPAHHCRSLLTAAHCSLPTDAWSANSLLTAHSACCLPCLSLMPFLNSSSHCYLPLQDHRRRNPIKGGRRDQGFSGGRR